MNDLGSRMLGAVEELKVSQWKTRPRREGCAGQGER